MSTDLTFITNEQGRTLADRFSVLLGGNTRCFDCLVGYFYLSGFHRLSAALKPTEKIRVLIGLSTDKPTFDLLKEAKDQMQMDLRSHAETKERIPGEILSELENVEDSSEVEAGVRQFPVIDEQLSTAFLNQLSGETTVIRRPIDDNQDSLTWLWPLGSSPKNAFSDQCHSRGEKRRFVQSKHFHRRATFCRFSYADAIFNVEMLVPTVGSRIKKANKLTGRRINSREIRTFVEVAVGTSQGEVL